MAGRASDWIPIQPDWESLRHAAAGWRACDLRKRGSQTLFGEGAVNASIVFAGEQPGNPEDLAGHPFAGPAGRLLDRALKEAGPDRSLAYATNVVTNFQWEPRGSRRTHAKPNAAEIPACRPWLDAELDLVRRRVLVCVGTAAQALPGRDFRVTRNRGERVESAPAPCGMATVDPFPTLRADTGQARHALGGFVQDLRRVRAVLELQTKKAR